MDFRVLGPLEIVARGGPVPTGSHKQRTVLAMLLMNSGRLVGLDELIDELWETDPPASAVANVRTYAANLRRLLAANDGGRTRISRRGSGYVLTVERGELDLSRYEELLSAARAARLAAEPGRVAQLLRGRPRHCGVARCLEDVRLGGALTAHRTALTETRHAAVDECAAALLEADDAAAAVALLREQVRRQPLREPSVALLMRALHRLGDVPGATGAFNRLRADLVAELGVEPGGNCRRCTGRCCGGRPRRPRPR